MDLSVIIVSYNEKEYLPDAIESCLSQKGDISFEIIIGDDGSDDGSIELIDEYARNYPEKISYFVMERNNGGDIIPSIRVSNVIKKAMTISRGEYVTLLSGDDKFINENKFAVQVDLLNKSDYVACYTDFLKFWSDGMIQNVVMGYNVNNYIFWSGLYVHISCFVFRKNVINNLTNSFCDDTGLIYSILCTGKCKYIPSVSFAYRQRDKSIMHNTNELELCIIELLLLQDVLNYGKYRKSSLSRCAYPLQYVFKHKDKLSDDKFKKYFEYARKFDNNILGAIFEQSDYNQRKIKKMIFYANCYRKMFKVVAKLLKYIRI